MLSHAARRLLCGIVAIGASACGSTTSEQVIGPTARCEITLAAPPSTIPASGSSMSLNVSAARDCTWTAGSDAPWVTVNPTSGQGSGAVAVAIAANAQPSNRSTAVAVNDTRVTISQEAAPCRFELAIQSTRVGFEGGHASVGVSTIDGCAWRASAPGTWVRVLTESGIGSGTVEMEASQNEGPERSATVTIAGSPFVVVQSARTGAPGGPGPSVPGAPGAPPPNPSSCGFSIDPDRATVRAAGGQNSVRVVTEAGCPWTAGSGTGWISVQRSGGSGPDSVAYQVSANYSTVSERSGSVVVAGRTHSVTQQACSLTLESGSPNLPPVGGTYEFRVITDPGCVWSATFEGDWINLLQANGAGNGAIIYRVAPNPIARDRSATITVSGRTKVITQQALGQS